MMKNLPHFFFMRAVLGFQLPQRFLRTYHLEKSIKTLDDNLYL